MTMNRALAALLGSAAIASCRLFDETAVRSIDGPLPNARVKFHNFSPNSVSVNFFANDVKLTAVGSSACTPLPSVDSLRRRCLTEGIEAVAGVPFGAAASGGLYSAIAPGQYSLTAKVARRDTVVSTLTQAIGDGKYYSVFLSGIYSATATPRSDAFIVEDPIPAGPINFAVAHVRFVNAVSNATGPISLFARDTANVETSVAAGTAYKGASAFITLPEGTYSFFGRYGATTAVAGLSATNLSLVGGQVYTVAARGSTATATTMALSIISNQR